MSKRSMEKNNWKLNLAKCTRQEADEYINEMREDGMDETIISHFLRDLASAKQDAKNYREKYGNETEVPQQTIWNKIRTPMPDGVFEVVTCKKARPQTFDSDGFVVEEWLLIDCMLLDHATGITYNFKRNYRDIGALERFFEPLMKWFKVDTWDEVYARLNKEPWYIEKVTRDNGKSAVPNVWYNTLSHTYELSQDKIGYDDNGYRTVIVWDE